MISNGRGEKYFQLWIHKKETTTTFVAGISSKTCRRSTLMNVELVGVFEPIELLRQHKTSWFEGKQKRAAESIINFFLFHSNFSLLTANKSYCFCESCDLVRSSQEASIELKWKVFTSSSSSPHSSLLLSALSARANNKKSMDLADGWWVDLMSLEVKSMWFVRWPVSDQVSVSVKTFFKSFFEKWMKNQLCRVDDVLLDSAAAVVADGWFSPQARDYIRKTHIP